MRPLTLIAFLIAPLATLGDEPVLNVSHPRVIFPSPPRAWLGLDVSKPDASITAHLPALPPGIGFVVGSIEKSGPAETAGLQEFDVLWKLGDQLLVNESQLAALLRLSKPGDEISLAGFRGGKPIEVKLRLGVAPARPHPVPGDLLDETILPGQCRGPIRLVNFSEKSATYSTDDGKLEVRREGAGYQVSIVSPKDEVVFDGLIAGDGEIEGVPDDWKRRVYVLRRELGRRLAEGYTPSRQPRPRVVAPVGANP